MIKCIIWLSFISQFYNKSCFSDIQNYKGSVTAYACPSAVEINKQQFKKHLNTISSYQEGRKKVLVDEYRDAISFLSIVTGINSKADYSSTIGYSNRTEYKMDMKKWGKWYKRNNCRLTDQYIDSAFKSMKLMGK